MADILKLVKKQNMWKTSAYDDLINQTIAAGIADLGIVGINVEAAQEDDLICMAVMTYCQLKIGGPTPQEAAQLEKSYHEQKAQLQSSRRYWGGNQNA